MERRYDDPADLIWIATARRLGMALARGDHAYASWDGAGTLTIAPREDLDADDCLAQMILHEICHALVQGEAGMRQLDWGLENVDDRDLVAEHACLRLQAELAGRVGLRAFMASTTQWRPYYDALPAAPLGPGDDPAIAAARAALARARALGWEAPLLAALEATAQIAAAAAAFAEDDALWAAATPRHPLGFALGGGGGTCGGCAWRFDGGPGPRVARCRQAAGEGSRPAPRVAPDWPACERFEPPLAAASCGTCGACCREGFHLAPVGRREALAKRHSELLVRDDLGLHLPRPGGHCVALAGAGEAASPWRCRVYADRPRACSDLAVASASCLLARRRVGLSR